MKAIRNVKQLPDILKAEGQGIYNLIGAIPVFSETGGVLVSNCGYIDLDCDAEYKYVEGKDVTEYITIDSVGDFVHYVLHMESYHKYLVDQPFGKFMKSELFWAVYTQIISPEENQMRADGSLKQDWSLSRIGTYYYSKKKETEIELEMSLIDYDSVQIWIPERDDLALSQCLNQLVKELNDTTADISDIPDYHVFADRPVHIPGNYDELYTTTQPGGIFDWLS